MADMSAAEALMAARTADIQISIDGDDLVLESAAEPPVAIVALLKEHKAGILTVLRSANAAWSAEDCQTEVAAAATASTPIIASGSADNIGSAAADITALRRSQGDEWSTKDWRAFFDERVGIAEFDGGLPRPQAEGRAYKACLAEWLDQHPVSSKVDDGCRVCGATDRPNDSLLPIGLGSGLERTWLHRDCVPAWRAARMAEAVAALAKLGVRCPEGSSP
jgi:hypothetical protein